MKYIRTKGGIYESNGLIQSNSTIEENSIIVCGGHFAIPVSNIIKQAEAVEELCDCWIIVLKYLNVKPYTENINCNIAHLINNEHQIYGAVWTYDSDGVPTLKVVAKMNEKGVLELL